MNKITLPASMTYDRIATLNSATNAALVKMIKADIRMRLAARKGQR
jgi:hypothetical protein